MHSASTLWAELQSYTPLTTVKRYLDAWKAEQEKAATLAKDTPPEIEESHVRLREAELEHARAETRLKRYEGISITRPADFIHTLEAY